MKYFTTKLSAFILFAAFGVFSACTSAPKSDEAQVGEAKDVQEVSASAAEYPADLGATVIEWVGTKVTGRHNGTLSLSDGKLMVKDGTLVGGKFTIDMASLASTDEKMEDDKNGKLTGHLKSDEFFDVAAYPTATFEITGIEALASAPAPAEGEFAEIDDRYRVSDPTHSVTGNFTMKGVTKSITFPAKVEMGDGTIRATARFNIDRTLWNVNYKGAPDNIISNTVHLGLGLVANAPAS